jgi:1-acyl-sn-glycerol-3-phosphate acyltransferase
MRYRIISGWSRLVVRLARTLCGIQWRVEGGGHLAAKPAVILSQHQSAWETLAYQEIFPPQVLVLKRELLWIPFFGWGLALMSPIAIDRANGRAALRDIARRGKERLAQGFWVVIFPEGTRVPPGETRAYQQGGAWLAAQCGVPVIPVAHNAGRLWPRNAFLKKAGLVTVRIGPPIPTAGRDAKQISADARAWIEGQQQTL